LCAVWVYLWWNSVAKATGYASQHIWCVSQARINWEGCARKGIWRKNGGMEEMKAPISLDGVAVHPDCWCVCPCYLHFASENPEDGKMYLLVPAHLGCPGQSPESCKMVVCVRVCVCSSVTQFRVVDSFMTDTFFVNVAVKKFWKSVHVTKVMIKNQVFCFLDTMYIWHLLHQKLT